MFSVKALYNFPSYLDILIYMYKESLMKLLKKFLQTLISVREGPDKVQKQGSDEKRAQEEYSTSAKIHSRCRVVFLCSFIFALFLYFFQVQISG